MRSVSFGNLATNNTQNSPETEKRLQSQENFGAIDTEKLKQDTVQIASKAGEQVKDNFLFRIMKNVFGVKDPKKTLKSIGLTFATIAGFAVLGNKASTKLADIGLKADDLVKNSKFLSGAGSKMAKVKDKVGGFFRELPVVKDVVKVLSDPKKRVKPKQVMAAAQCSGVKYQFASAVIESMQGIFYGQQKNIAKNYKGILTSVDGKKLGAKKLFELAKEISASKITKEQLVECAKKSPEELMGMIKKEEITEHLATLLKEVDLKNSKASEFIDKVLESAGEHKKLLVNICGEGDVAGRYSQIVLDNASDRVAFVNEFTDAIRKKAGSNGKSANNKELLKFFKRIEKGEGDFAACKDISMVHGMDSWCTTNWIDKLGSKIFKNKWKNISKANLGSTLIKYNAVSGKLADTGLGKAIQGVPTIVTESVSNYVCDMAFINAIVIPSYISLYNNVQDAPKEKKLATLADNFVSDVGNLTVVMPLAGGLTYSLASLSNLEGKGLTKPLKWIGNLFSIGLKPGHGKIKGMLGGTLRLISVMFVFSGLIRKPIDKLVNKIFGKPYNEEEEKQKQAIEAQKNQVIPGLNITYGQLEEKAKNNPQVIQRMQTDALYAQEMLRNPEKLIAALDGKEVDMKPKDKLVSPANQALINKAALKKQPQEQNAAVASNTVAAQKNSTSSSSYDSATYIPSSAFSAKSSTISTEQAQEYTNLMTRADKILKDAEKYI